MAEKVVDAVGLAKSYQGVLAVRSLNFSVNRGEIFGFLGPNGAGKTSTLRMLLDIVSPDQGELQIFGEQAIGSVRHRIGYLPEERGLYPKMSVLGVILYFARLRGVTGRQARVEALGLLERFGLRQVARQKVKSLSKGMMQKVQLIAAILHKPALLVLDEPFSGLDPVNQALLEDIILECRDAGATIIFSTHIMQHAERLCDQFLIINKGRKIFDGTLAEARNALPPKIVIKSRRAISFLATLDSVSRVVEVSAPEKEDPQGNDLFIYHVFLTEGAHVYPILKACIDAGIEVQQFDCSPPSLHDIFIRLIDEGTQDEGETANA